MGLTLPHAGRGEGLQRLGRKYSPLTVSTAALNATRPDDPPMDPRGPSGDGGNSDPTSKASRRLEGHAHTANPADPAQVNSSVGIRFFKAHALIVRPVVNDTAVQPVTNRVPDGRAFQQEISRRFEGVRSAHVPIPCAAAPSRLRGNRGRCAFLRPNPVPPRTDSGAREAPASTASVSPCPRGARAADGNADRVPFVAPEPAACAPRVGGAVRSRAAVRRACRRSGVEGVGIVDGAQDGGRYQEQHA
jgi:hypothetical protein